MSSMGFLHSGTQAKGYVIFTSSQNWQVPAGVHKIKALIIGGGGGGGGGNASYSGGGGGAGGTTFAEIIVQPGTELSIAVGGGGGGGTGGSSPTAGKYGGGSAILWGNVQIAVAGPGAGGGAASSSANGSPGPASTIYNLMQFAQPGSTPVFPISAYALQGAGGSGQNGGLAPAIDAAYTGAANVNYQTYGAGGDGGGVNQNGQSGFQGVVVIWWGDD